MENILELLAHRFFQNAVWTILLTSLLSAMIGTYIVSRKIVFISGGITHASFGGIGLAYFLGINPFLGAIVFAVTTALGIEWISSKGKIREDSAIAILWSLGMALGIIFVFLTPGYTPNLMSFLFGSILSVDRFDLFILALIVLVTALLFVFLYRPIVYTAFDPEFSKTRGVPVLLIRNIMAVLMALAIVLSIRVMGIILVLSLFTIPQNTALLFTNDFKRIIFGSIFWSIIGALIGLGVAYYLNIPGGAAIIFVLTIQFFLVKVFVWFKRLKKR